MKSVSLACVGLTLAFVIGGFVGAGQSKADSPSCGADGGGLLSGHLGEGSVGVSGACGVTSTDLPGRGASPVLVIDCGYATATDDHTHWNKACGPTGFPCPPIPGEPAPHQFITVVSLNQAAVPIAAWCAGANTPMPSAAALRDQVTRLLHAPAIGISPDTGTALVNLRTLFWVNTASTLDLGNAKLIGFPVALRVSYLRTDFDFGDATADTLTATVGTPYDPGADCGPCADRFGHDYTKPGNITVTARVYWHAQFLIRNGAWTDIPGDVTATQPARAVLTVKQSRGTLVRPR